MQLNQYQQAPPQQQVMPQQQQMQYYPQQGMPIMQPQPAVRTEQQKMFDLLTEQQNALILLNNKMDTMLTSQQDSYSSDIQFTNILEGLEKRISDLEKENERLTAQLEDTPKIDLEELFAVIAAKVQPAKTGLQSKKVIKE